MNYADITKCSIADGQGFRYVLWVSGCSHHCEDCHNKETWDFNYGKTFTEETLKHLISEIDKSYVQGLTLSGGDPLAVENREGVAEVVKAVKEALPEKDIWVYTGFAWEDVKSLGLMDYVDVLVDGEYHKGERDITLAFRGSSNQRLIDVQKSLQSSQVVLFNEGE